MSHSEMPAAPPLSPPPPRKFDKEEYLKYKDLPDMPQSIPDLSAFHYVCLLVPLALMLVLYVHQREAAARDEAEEQDRLNRIRVLLAVGAVFATAVAMVHLRLIPPSVVRRFWRQPEPVSKPMKVAIILCLGALVLCPTAKLLWRTEKPESSPRVHRMFK